MGMGTALAVGAAVGVLGARVGESGGEPGEGGRPAERAGGGQARRRLRGV